MESLDRRRDCRTPEDLVGEAMLLILSGKRIWRPGVCSMRQLILGTMRSQVSHWRSAAGPDPEPTSNGDAASIDLEAVEGNAPEPWRDLADEEDRLATERWFEKLIGQFRGDATLSHLLSELREGRPPSRPAGRAARKRYEAAMKRLYRRAREKAAP